MALLKRKLKTAEVLMGFGALLIAIGSLNLFIVEFYYWELWSFIEALDKQKLQPFMRAFTRLYLVIGLLLISGAVVATLKHKKR